MAEPLYIMQNSFAGGEFSPTMDARQDLQKYVTGVSLMRNFYVLPHGAAKRRPGLRFVSGAGSHERKSRLIPFQFSTEQVYVIEFGHLYCRFFRDGSALGLEIDSPYREEHLPDLKFTQSADVLYIAHPAVAPRKLSRISESEFEFSVFEFKNGPFLPLSTTPVMITPSGITGDITLTADTPIPGGCLLKIEHDMEAQTLSEDLSSIDNSTNSLRGLGQWSLTTHGIWTGTIVLEKSEDGVTWTKLRQYSAKGEYNVADSGTEDDLCYIRVTATSWSSGSVSADLEWFPYTHTGIVRVAEGGLEARATVLEELGSTNPTDTWHEGAWSDRRGWPATVGFYQNRLFFANTYWQPQTLWGSKSGNYVDFGVSSPVVDDDSVSIPLVSNQVNAIHSLKALSTLLGFTEGGHWTISDGSETGALTPTSINATPEGYFGANKIDPLVVGNRILFVQTKGAIVRDVGYDFSSDSYMGSNLGILAEHLFRDRKIADWAYQQEPNSIIWCVTSDGVLLGLTYIREQEIWAWHRHETDGFFESVCVVPGDEEDEVWFVVRRLVNGESKRYVERMAAYESESDPAEQFFVDSGLSYYGETASVFEGLEHLEGKTVQILADGHVYPEQVVVNGAVTLPDEASKVHIGLGYNSDIKTLNIDFPARDGTIQSRSKRIVEVTLRLENTRGAFVGGSFGNMYELKMRDEEYWDVPIRLYSGDKSMTLDGGSDREGRVCIRVNEPLPVTVLAIIFKVVLD